MYALITWEVHVVQQWLWMLYVNLQDLWSWNSYIRIQFGHQISCTIRNQIKQYTDTYKMYRYVEYRIDHTNQYFSFYSVFVIIPLHKYICNASLSIFTCNDTWLRNTSYSCIIRDKFMCVNVFQAKSSHAPLGKGVCNTQMLKAREESIHCKMVSDKDHLMDVFVQKLTLT